MKARVEYPAEEKVFNPFDFVIRVESLEEARDLYARFDLTELAIRFCPEHEDYVDTDPDSVVMDCLRKALHDQGFVL